MAINFVRHRSQTVTTSGTPLTEPAGATDSFIAFLSETTPGGAVMAQSLIVLFVYAMFLYRAPGTPQGVIMSAIVLILTAWVPALLGYGDPIAASIIFINVLAGAYAYRSFTRQAE